MIGISEMFLAATIASNREWLRSSRLLFASATVFPLIRSEFSIEQPLDYSSIIEPLFSSPSLPSVTVIAQRPAHP
jgi:hypothetical protein